MRAALFAGWTRFPYERSHAGQVLALSSGKADYRKVLDAPSNLSIVKVTLAERRGDAVKCELDLGQGRVCESAGVLLPGGSPIRALLIDLPAEVAAFRICRLSIGSWRVW